MRRSDRRLYLNAIASGLIGGFITLAAGLAGIGRGQYLNSIQDGWIVLAAVASSAYTSFRLLTTARAARKETSAIGSVGSKMDEASEVLDRIDTRDRDSTLVLLARILTICTEQAVRVVYDPALFHVLVQISLECLHTALARSHGTDGAGLRVAVLSYRPMANAVTPSQELICYPDDGKLRLEPAEEIADHAGILMSRRHPYENGWLRCPDDGIPPGPEGHILRPGDRGVESYIRVGIPHVGVLLVDSWDLPLSVAERMLTVAFADVLALPYSMRAAAAPAIPGQAAADPFQAAPGPPPAAAGRELEGAQ